MQTLRDELRKVQSGILMSEKQRNPGVGYFSNYAANGSSSTASPLASPPVEGSHPSTGPSTPLTKSQSDVGAPSNSKANDEAMNFEYIRNVILQFLEHKEMRVSP